MVVGMRANTRSAELHIAVIQVTVTVPRMQQLVICSPGCLAHLPESISCINKLFQLQKQYIVQWNNPFICLIRAQEQHYLFARNYHAAADQIIMSPDSEYSFIKFGQMDQHIPILKPRKSEICRFYLRGLCMFSDEDCYFAHNVWDLHYEPYIEGEVIEYDYSKIDKNLKETIIKGPRNYKGLYNFQKQKIFTLDELNEDSGKRKLVRNAMYQQMYLQFIQLLTCYYPDQLLTEYFLIREFTRVGFNKPMSIIKLSHISANVCDVPSSPYAVVQTLLPPRLQGQQSVLVTVCSEQEMMEFYREAYEEYLTSKEQAPSENELKKYLFSVYRSSLSILPLNLVLKKKKMSFSDFLKGISGSSETGVVLQASEQSLLKAAACFIEEKVAEGPGYCSWQDIYKHLAAEYKVNNANITNPLKPKLIAMGYIFLNFPMLQIVTKSEIVHDWKWKTSESEPKTVCICEYQQPYPQEDLLISLQAGEQLPPKQSLDVYDMDTLLRCAPHILNSKVLGVDIEGRLRKNGYIEMIQLNNGVNTFLLDIHSMLMHGQMQAFELTKKILRNILCNGNVLKIFHDCRHDTLVLHEIMNTCVINIFDTSAVETYIGQLDLYKSEQDYKKLLKTITNVVTPGLNDILKKYEAPHGINQNKNWFHQLWKKGHTDLFEKRPLDPQYREYCIKDVLDLPFVYERMIQPLCPEFTNWLSSHYVKAGYLYYQDPEEK